MATDDDQALKALLMLKRGGESQVGAARIRLLSLIHELGSISAAAKAMEMSYKGAWDAVQALNNLSRRPVVTAVSGGRAGGAAEVTPAGLNLIRAFGKIEGLLDSYAGLVAQSLGEEGVDAIDLLGSLSMKTTARNAYRGVITAVVDGAVSSEVRLRIAEETELVAIVTRESVAALGLGVGRSAVALIKSSFVILAATHEVLPISARNAIKGVIAAIVPGTVNDEVTLDIGEGKTMTAIITHESCVELGLAVGQPTQGLVKASHIILAVD